MAVVRDASPNVLVLAGPTASGKTALSLLVARRLGGEILSADSRQIYRYMDIGTAKPSTEERQGIPHHFVDELTPDVDFNAGEFGKRGREVIDEIFARGKVPVIVGGSGLYVRSLIDGFFEGPSSDSALRATLYKRAREDGGSILLDELRRVDPEAARGMLPTNIRRIVRALEVFHLTGSTMTQLRLTMPPIRFTPVFFGLRWDRATLYRRIDARVDEMLARGFLDEVRDLLARGYAGTLNALQTVGYKEAYDHLGGKLTFDEMIKLIQRNSRRYAKRQLTWFRKDGRITWMDIAGEQEYEELAERIAGEFEQTPPIGRKPF